MLIMRFRTQHWLSSAGKNIIYRGADKSLARPRKKQASVTEDFDVHITYL